MAETSLTESILLLRRMKTGDQEALDILFKRYADRLLRIVRLRLGREVRGKLESVDVLQEVWRGALGDIADFEPSSEGALLHWFAQKIEWKIRDLKDYFRAGKRDSRAEEPLDEPPADGAPRELPGADPTPSRVVEREDEARRIESALDGMDPEQKELIILHVYEDLGFVEIGAMKGKSPDAVRMAFSRSMAQLTRRMEGARA